MKNKLAKLEKWIEKWKDPEWQKKFRNAGGRDTEPECNIAVVIEMMFEGKGFLPRNEDNWELFSGNKRTAQMLNTRMKNLEKIIMEIPIGKTLEAKRLLQSVFYKLYWD